MKERIINKKYDISLNFCFRPNEIRFLEIKEEIIKAKLDFDSSLLKNHQNILNSLYLCLIRKKGFLVGWFYCLKINKNPIVIHQGLMVIKKDNYYYNMSEMVSNIMNKLIYQEVGEYFATTITSVPKVYEIFMNLFSNVYPNPIKDKCFRIPKMYENMNNILKEKYINVFYSNNNVSYVSKYSIFIFDEKVQSLSKNNILDFPQSELFLLNIYMDYIIDYNKDSTLMIVGEMNEKRFKQIEKMYE